ncbi:MAG: phosphotransferase enzyme family protein [Sedimentitalea sp.]
MTPQVAAALHQWGWASAQAQLIAERENAVWKVTQGGQTCALRFHRPGYRSAIELQSELHWLTHLADAGLTVPRPVAQPSGDVLGQVGAHPVSLLSWMPGQMLGAQGAFSQGVDPIAVCRQVGQTMARLHDACDRWSAPLDFTRPNWRRAALVGPDPLWGRFWEHPQLNTEQRDLLQAARVAADAALAQIEDVADQGLIHADMLLENLMIEGTSLALIDFDDGAFGFRDFELATFLLKLEPRPDYPALRAALCEGYAVRRHVIGGDLDLFLLLRALTYPGWIAKRLDEPGAIERSHRAIETALRHARRWLGTPSRDP